MALCEKDTIKNCMVTYSPIYCDKIIYFYNMQKCSVPGIDFGNRKY